MISPHRAARLRRDQRRPITDDEVPYLEAMGEALRRLREFAGLTYVTLSRETGVSAKHLSELEHAVRRTRRSTLVRIAAQYAEDDDDVAELVEYLAALVGPALAPESEYRDRVERRRARRLSKKERIERQATKLAARMAREMAYDLTARDIATWHWLHNERIQTRRGKRDKQP